MYILKYLISILITYIGNRSYMLILWNCKLTLNIPHHCYYYHQN